MNIWDSSGRPWQAWGVRRLGWVLVLLCMPLGGARADDLPRGAWRDLTIETGAAAIGGRQQFGMAAAPDGTLYLYGGASGDRALDDLWALPPGGRWQQLHPPAQDAPPALIEPHLAVDTAGRLYEFGGVGQDGRHFGDLRRYDPGSGRWTLLHPTGPAPPPRQDHGFVYDAGGDALYVFGGESSSLDLLNDFWRFDLATGRWSDLTEASGARAIAPRELYNLTHDGRGHLYLFGGTIDGGDSYPRRLNDFWRYDLVSGRWEALTATGSATVPGRHYYGQAADAEGRFYVLGGFISPESAEEAPDIAGDLWVYQPGLGVWENLTALASPVLPRIPYAMISDPRTGELALFGGVRVGSDGSTALASDFWRWAPASPPASRRAGATASGRIGPAGGDVRAGAGSLVLALPVGALATEQAVTVSWTSPPMIAGAVAGIDVRVDGVAEGAFRRRADLMARLDLLPDGSLRRKVELHHRGPDGRWLPVTGRIQSDGRTFASRIAAAGGYALVAVRQHTLVLPMLTRLRPLQ